MKIGDKVRFIHRSGGGIVTGHVDDKTIEVSVDGFNIPVLKGEVTVIANEEREYFKRDEDEAVVESNKQVVGDEGVFLAIYPLTGNRYRLYWINNSHYHGLVNISQQKGEEYFELYTKACDAVSYADIGVFDWNDFPLSLAVQMAYYKKEAYDPIEPLFEFISVDRTLMMKEMKMAPVLSKQVYLMPIEYIGEAEAVEEETEVNIEAIKESLLSGTPSEEPIKLQGKHNHVEEERKVDLHIEQLVEDLSDIASDEIGKYQMTVFEKELDNAIKDGVDKITFIHGIGNGVLRDQIHRYLSRHQSVQYFEDAQKEKFGYGATRAKII